MHNVNPKDLRIPSLLRVLDRSPWPNFLRNLGQTWQNMIDNVVGCGTISLED